MKNSILKIGYLLAGVIMMAPIVAFAQNAMDSSKGIGKIISIAGNLINGIVPVIIAIAVIMFFWGLLKYVTAKEADGHKEAVSVMVSGLVVLFVMVSLWGLVNLLGDTFDIKSTEDKLKAPQVLI